MPVFQDAAICVFLLRPADAVRDHLMHDLVVIDRVGLVAGAEEENAPAPALEGAAAAEHLATGIPGDEHKLVRLRNIEGLAVHFRGIDLEIGRQSLGDRMRGIDDPDAFEVAFGKLAP